MPSSRGFLAPSRLAGAALVAAAAAVIFVPMPSIGCSSAIVSYLDRDQPSPSDGGEPAPSDALVSARVEVDQAQRAVSEVDALDDDVSTQREAAIKAQEAADSAQAEADSASYDADFDDPTSSAELDVEMAENQVDYANDAVQSAQEMLDMDRDYGFDTSYSQQAVQDAEDDLAEAKADLAKKRAALNEAQAAAASTRSTLQSKAAQAKKLQDQADKLQAAADEAQEAAWSQRQDAEAALGAAQSRADELEVTHTKEVNAWTASHLRHVGQVRALNAQRADCRAAAARSGAGAATLLATGLMLLVPRRALRLSRPRLPTRLRRS